MPETIYDNRDMLEIEKSLRAENEALRDRIRELERVLADLVM